MTVIIADCVSVEYGAMTFGLFFLGEYANMILMSGMTSILFLGGWQPPFDAAQHRRLARAEVRRVVQAPSELELREPAKDVVLGHNGAAFVVTAARGAIDSTPTQPTPTVRLPTVPTPRRTVQPATRSPRTDRTRAATNPTTSQNTAARP